MLSSLFNRPFTEEEQEKVERALKDYEDCLAVILCSEWYRTAHPESRSTFDNLVKSVSRLRILLPMILQSKIMFR